MLNARSLFLSNIAIARSQSALFTYLSESLVTPVPIDELLRAQLVYAVSAFDKLIHDLVRIGMVQIFLNQRVPTPSYEAETVSMQAHRAITLAIANATVPPAELIFEAEVVRKFSTSSFQEAGKVAKALSLIWAEAHKWQKIGDRIGASESDTRTKLNLIVIRRNGIVHEADIDPSTNQKIHIDINQAADATDFLERCGTAIVDLVV